jgi:hypothetical protein
MIYENIFNNFIEKLENSDIINLCIINGLYGDITEHKEIVNNFLYEKNGNYDKTKYWFVKPSTNINEYHYNIYNDIAYLFTTKKDDSSVYTSYETLTGGKLTSPFKNEYDINNEILILLEHEIISFLIKKLNHYKKMIPNESKNNN